MSETFGPSSRVVAELNFHGRTLSLETGWYIKQADGAVFVRQGDTVVMVTVCSAGARPNQDFFPLTVEYQEKAYAAGKIPGGFFKREARPGEHEILSCRLIDRPLRPLFPDGYVDEVQVIAQVISADGENDPDVLAICGASAALHISPLPFDGPVGAVRVGRIDGQLVINPSPSQLEKSDFNFVVAAKRDALVMVEGEASEVPEAEVLDALFFAHEEIKKLIDLQEELRSKKGKPKNVFVPPAEDTVLRDRVKQLAQTRLEEALKLKIKMERRDAMSSVSTDVLTALKEEFPEKDGAIKGILDDLSRTIARRAIVKDKRRIDGRGPRDIRPIYCETGVLPRAHGSAVFTRGETQVMSVTTLGTSMDAQRIETLMGKPDKTFMLHYNFAPFSVGEAKMMRGTGRREIGHGVLAERAVSKILPDQKQFPYVIRVVGETFESNGSSSMATVCSTSMSLMDAGVPTKSPVGGVAMGLIMEDGDVEIITDILGDEDHFGDMDFKVCGTKSGITALQMDIKCEGLSRDLMDKALQQAKDGRFHILDEMAKALSAPRDTMSKYAPRITTIKINPDKIRELIGPGGKMIQSITATTGVKIDISDDGTVCVASSNEESTKRALELIKGVTEEAEIGRVYQGVVKRITDFGAFVEIMPGTEGLVHISQLAHERVREVGDVVREGDEVPVRVLDIDRQGRIRLSRKEALPQPGE